MMSVRVPAAVLTGGSTVGLQLPLGRRGFHVVVGLAAAGSAVVSVPVNGGGRFLEHGYNFQHLFPPSDIDGVLSLLHHQQQQ